MIKYTLQCSDNHRFESWFASSESFEKLAAAGLLTCAVCGATRVEKALMAPRVQAERRAEAGGPAPVARTEPVAAPAKPEPPQPSNPTPEQLMKALRKHIESNSDYVGSSFAMEARRIHDGDAPQRSIYGEANKEEVKSLLDDGVSVAPLPFIPTRKTN